MRCSLSALALVALSAAWPTARVVVPGSRLELGFSFTSSSQTPPWGRLGFAAVDQDGAEIRTAPELPASRLYAVKQASEFIKGKDVVPFFIDPSPGFNHSFLTECYPPERWEDDWASSQMAEFWTIQLLAKHPWRTQNPAAAKIIVIPALFHLSYTVQRVTRLLTCWIQLS